MKNSRGIFAALTLALLAPAGLVLGQQANVDASAADRAIVASRTANIKQSAKIYGYDLGAGNWTPAEVGCAALPDVILLHYVRIFPDGAQSRFTAVVPRAAGRVRIVPVLYHGATPFVPAAANPRNYALFNQLVQQAGGDAHDRLRLSGCYAELTGGDSFPLPETRPAIAGAPGPTLHLQPETKTSHVTLASRATRDSYQVWNISFSSKGQVTRATAEEHQTGNSALNERAQAQPASKTPALEPGWKYIPQPPDPHSKFVPAAPQPPEKPLKNW